MKKILPILILAILLAGCGGGSSDRSSLALMEAEEEIMPVTRQSGIAPMAPVETIEKKDAIEKKIIKDGRIGLRVKELKKTKLRVDSLVRVYGAYYAKESFNNTNWESSFDLKIRIPSANFEKLIAAIESGNDEIRYKEIDARDVTDQFIDLETRLENKENYLKRYQALLMQARSIKKILEIEEKIRGLEEEIESTTGRLKYLSDQVDYSTLDLRISKRKDFKYNPENRDRFTERLKQSISKGWYGFVDFLLFVIKIWPFWIIVSLVIYLWRRWRRNRRIQRQKNLASEGQPEK